jgi:hypothetical protein
MYCGVFTIVVVVYKGSIEIIYAVFGSLYTPIRIGKLNCGRNFANILHP